MDLDGGQRPDIEYPCPWDFKVIGTCEESLRGAVRDCLAASLNGDFGDREFELGLSRTSSGGKYVSLCLNLMVMDEPERNAIFASLAGHPEIRMVI
ncbi:DUF493 domain-containing protein [bacterium]|nr:DUF493 domain-containing protein [bacterium]